MYLAVNLYQIVNLKLSRIMDERITKIFFFLMSVNLIKKKKSDILDLYEFKKLFVLKNNTT